MLFGELLHVSSKSCRLGNPYTCICVKLLDSVVSVGDTSLLYHLYYFPQTLVRQQLLCIFTWEPKCTPAQLLCSSTYRPVGQER